MKKLKISIITVVAVILLCMQVYAADAQIQLNGENEAKAGEAKTLTVKLTNDEEVGVVEGNITCDSNIENMQVSSSYNGWMINYNEATGKFNTLNANGTKDGEILQITYQLKSDATKGTIKLSNLTLTTISYDTITLPDSVEKTITVGKSGSEGTTDTDTNTNSNNNTNTNTDKKATNTTNTTKETSSSTNSTSTNTNNTQSGNQVTTTNGETTDKSTANTILPKTGKTISVIVLLIIFATGSVILYRKNKEYKDVK